MGSGGAKRAPVSTKTKYEFQFGYSRAVRHGDQVRVAGTAGLRKDGSVISDDVVEQMRRALAVLGGADEKR
ncbi:MAG: Rid family hydrolase [Chloroflexota bacterium]